MNEDEDYSWVKIEPIWGKKEMLPWWIVLRGLVRFV